jgi:hypothetical protein
MGGLTGAEQPARGFLGVRGGARLRGGPRWRREGEQLAGDVWGDLWGGGRQPPDRG